MRPVPGAVLWPTVLLAAALMWAARPAPVPALLAPGPAACADPPVFRLGYQKEEGGVRADGAGFNFAGEGWIQAQTCGPGTLRLTAEGDLARGEAPVLYVALDTAVLLDRPVGALQTFEVTLPTAGKVTLGYFNDLYQADVRVATLSGFGLEAPGCDTLQVDVPPATGGSWQPELGQARLVLDAPMTVTPCEPGTLSVDVAGRAGLGAFPQLRFAQSGRTLLTAKATEEAQTVHLDVARAPLEITLLNPAGRVLADRNLRLLEVEFVRTAR